MKWVSRAKLRLTVGPRHVKDWSDKKSLLVIESIFKELQLEEGDAKVTINIQEREKIIVEFTALLYVGSVSAAEVVSKLEQRFLGLKIYKRELSYEER